MKMLALMLLAAHAASVVKPSNWPWMNNTPPQPMEVEQIWGWCDANACCTTKDMCRAKGCTARSPICCPADKKLLRYNFNRGTWDCVKIYPLPQPTATAVK